MRLFSTAKVKKIKPARLLEGTIGMPGDKSISHRYAMLAAISTGPSEIHFFSSSADCQSTLDCLQQLGVRIDRPRRSSRASQGSRTGKPEAVRIEGAGLCGLRPAPEALNAGNSGTTMRMLSGILAGQSFSSTLIGDASLSRRPMKRVIEPMSRMGARIAASEGGLPPLEVAGLERGDRLKAIRYELPIPSAQVKSCVLLAGLYAEGETEVFEPVPTRDHTEIALEHMGANIGRHGQTVAIRGLAGGPAGLEGTKLYVPGDISSATFFVAAALLVPDSTVTIRNVGLNPTRTAILDVLIPMGGRIRTANVDTTNGEIFGDLSAETSRLKGGEIPIGKIPALIDELPMLAVLGTQTEEGLAFHGAQELRVKESDRLKACAENLRRMGAQVEEFPDGLRVAGRQKLRGAEIESFGDHRIAMAFAVAGLVAESPTAIHDSGCVEISFPEFFDVLEGLVK